MNVSDLRGKLALVTGAASGIGRETALALARRGADVALCDVNAEGLARTADDARALGRTAHTREVDVARADDVRAFADQLHGEVPAVDILVNNAGVGLGGGFVDTSLDDWNWIVSINLMGVVHGCHFFVPKMIERGAGGHVVNVASAAGLVASEPLVAYATTKFAVVGLSEGLRDELTPHRIGVTAICPGIINTPITTSARLRGKAALDGAREEMVRIYQKRNYGPERVAEKIVKAIGRNAAVAPVSPEAWGLYLLKRFVPGLVSRLSRFQAAQFEGRMQSLGIGGGEPG